MTPGRQPFGKTGASFPEKERIRQIGPEKTTRSDPDIDGKPVLRIPPRIPGLETAKRPDAAGGEPLPAPSQGP